MPAHRAAIADIGRNRGIPVASHDDEKAEHIMEAKALGICASEFPVTVEAAEAARDAGLTILMGAPNMVRGGSHSGNVAASELAQRGLLDVFASDYVPASMLTAALALTQDPHGWSVSSAIATVTSNAATAGGLTDRGAISIGLRADLARVTWLPGLAPFARMVWRQGQRVV